MRKKGDRLEKIVVLILISLFFVASSIISVNRYYQYDAFWYDFGIFDETIYQLSRFQAPIISVLNPPDGKIVWGDHLNPSAVFIVPFYWITDKQEIMFIAQALFVSVGGLVGYLLSRRYIESSLARIALVVSFLGFVGMQNALYTDAHNIVFSVPFVMLTFWAFYLKKIRLYFLFLLISLGFQESMAGFGVGIGLFTILVSRKNLKLGLITIAISLSWAIAATQIIIPYFNTGPYKYAPTIPQNITDVITGFIIPVDLKLKTIITSFATFGFLPITTIAIYPMLFEHFATRFVFNTAATRWDLGFHYNALLSPILFIGAFDAILRFQKQKAGFIKIWAMATIFLVFVITRFIIPGPLLLAIHPVFYSHTRNFVFLDDFFSKIPKDGLIMTQNNLASRLTHQNVVLLSQNYEKIMPSVVALDLREGQNPNNFFPLVYEETITLSEKLDVDPNYEKHKVGGDQVYYLKIK